MLDRCLIGANFLPTRRSSLPAQLGSRCSWLELVSVLILSCSLQSNTLGAEFTFDDARGVVANKDLQASTPWTDLFLHDFWG
jgi:hypothetical protein